MSLDDPVLEFHRTMGAAIAQPREDWSIDRIALLREEFGELDDALTFGSDADVLRELADIVVLATGTAIALGYLLEPVYAEVCRANLRKLGPDGKPILRPHDGKVLKPPGWTPPNVEAHMIPIEPPESAE